MSTEQQREALGGTNPHGSGHYIPILDGWRAIAILLVVVFHGLYNSETLPHPPLAWLTRFSGRTGAMGVLIFFCISGFLITQRLLAEHNTYGRISLRAFYIRRAFRILPPLGVYLLSLLVLFFAGAIVLIKGDLAAPFFVSNYVAGSWYTMHFWSLSVEEHFYLFWPVCIWLAGWRRAMWIGLGIVAAVAVWRPWELHHVSNVNATLWHTDMRIDYLMLGSVAAIALHFYPSMRRWLAACGTPTGLVLLFLALVVTVKIQVFDMRSAQALILTLMVCGSAVADAPLCNRVLANRPMLFIGKISYSLYIWQQLFTSANFRSPWFLPLKIVIAFAVALLSYRFVEQPFIRMGRKLARADQKPAPVLAAQADLSQSGV